MGWYDGMDPEFARRLRALIEASAGRLGVGSGFRSVEEQAALWADAQVNHPDDPENWVAPPGRSNHNWGVAADLAYLTGDGSQWAHANAARFGLVFPMEWEDWHIEPVGVRDGTYKTTIKVAGQPGPGTPEAYTTPPSGQQQVVDATRRFDLGYQLESLHGLMLRPPASSVLAGSNPALLAGPDGGQLAGSDTQTASAAAPQRTEPAQALRRGVS